MFANWHSDTSDVIQKALQHDFELWKVGKFVKDSKDLAGVKNFFEEHFAIIKEIRIGAIASSLEPYEMDLKTFHLLMNLTNIKSGGLNTGILDGLFNAVNFEETDMTTNDDRKLVRYEFFEILTRIAKEKYIRSKRVEEN